MNGSVYVGFEKAYLPIWSSSFLEYRRLNHTNDIEEERIMEVARLVPSVVAVGDSFEHRRRRGGNRQNVYMVTLQVMCTRQ